MYRTSSHDPRYRHLALHRRDDESGNSSSGEEDDSCTECLSEETMVSPDSESLLKESECSAETGSYVLPESCTRLAAPSSFVTTHLRTARIQKHDKITQKNLLSPFPSFTLPPVYREVSRPNRERQCDSKRSPQQTSRVKESFTEDGDSICCIHKCELMERRVPERYGNPKEHKKGNRPEQILACVNAGKPAKPLEKRPPETPVKEPKYRAPPPPVPHNKTPARPKTADPEVAGSSKSQEPRVRSRRRTSSTICPSVSHPTLQGDCLQAKLEKGKKEKPPESGSGEVREKLVYVVEEEGKDIAKLETDLFTLNEIFTIKKDLLELSEFAKKLKKLKEMKKESEDGKHQQNLCHCQTAADLLKDVNKRIEVLEARQEELEKGNKFETKEFIKTESNKVVIEKKFSSELKQKTGTLPKGSAVTTAVSFPKVEMIVSRDDFSNNSDIVNELMDIKTQLQKLEQKRTAKAFLEDIPPPDGSKLVKKDDCAIAVYSSRTYILTDNFDSRKDTVKEYPDEKRNHYSSTIESNKQLTQGHVENWLKGIAPKGAVSPNETKRDESAATGNDRCRDVNCNNRWQVTNVEDTTNQEPHKNRATKKDEGRSDRDFVTKQGTGKSNQPYVYKECIVTPSGKIFACLNKSCETLTRDPHKQKTIGPPKKPPQPAVTTESIYSVPSVVTTKEEVRKIKKEKKRRGAHLPPKIINSRIGHDLTPSSSMTKKEKTARNKKLKNMQKTPPPKEKKQKDRKNQFLKILEAHLLALTKSLGRTNPSSSSCSYSEFLASINLDTVTTSQSLDSSKLQEGGLNGGTVMAYAATAKTDEEIVRVDNCDAERKKKKLKEEEEKRKKREKDCKKIVKRSIQEQKRSDSLERKKKMQQLKCEWKKLKQKCKDLKNRTAAEDTSKSGENCCTVSNSSTRVRAKKSTESCYKKTSEYCNTKDHKVDEACQVKKLPQYDDEMPTRKQLECDSEEIYKKRHPTCEEVGTRKYRYELDCPSKRYLFDDEASCRRQLMYDDDNICRRHRAYDDDVHRRQRLLDVEDVQRKYRLCDEDVKRKRRHEEEAALRRYYHEKEKNHRMRRLSHEPDLSRLYRREFECRTKYRSPENDKISTRKIIPIRSSTITIINTPRRPYKPEVYRQSGEKISVPQFDKSEDSLKFARKRHEERLKVSSSRKDKPSVESCKLRNIVKNIGKLKINIPFQGEFCDGKHIKCKKSTAGKERQGRRDRYRHSRQDKHEESDEEAAVTYHRKLWDQYTPKEEDFEYFGEEADDDEDEYEEEEDEYQGHHHYDMVPPECTSRNNHSHYQHHHGQTNCNCYRVFMPSTVERGWSGFSPFRKLTSDTATEGSNSKTIESSKTIPSNFAFPKMKNRIFHVAHSSEQKKKKCHKKKHKKERKKHKKHCKKHKHKKEDHCRCKKCGNIHVKGCTEELEKKEETLAQCADDLQQETFKSKHPEITLPLFTFLSQFCKGKPSKTKCSFVKLPCMRACNQERQTHSNPPCPKEESPCLCKPRLEEIENRLSELEIIKEEHEHSKRNTKKNKKRCACSECASQSTECSDDVCRRKQCNRDKRRGMHCRPDCDCKQKKRKKCKKRCLKKCRRKIAECDSPRPCETSAYYQTICCPSVVDVLNRTTSSKSSKASVVNEKDSTESTKSKDQKCQKTPKERLSSLTSFWQNLCKYTISNGRNGAENLMRKIRGKKSSEEIPSEEPSLNDDCSRSSPSPRFQYLVEPKKQKKHSSKKKESKSKIQKKKERKESKKEKSEMKSPHWRKTHDS